MGDQPVAEILYEDDHELQFEIRIPGIEILEGTIEGHIYDRVEIVQGGFNIDPGAPEVPNYSKLIAIPATSGVRVELEVLESEDFLNIDLMPAQGVDPVDFVSKKSSVSYSDAIYSKDEFYPTDNAISGEPALMRGIRLIPIQMNPVKYNPVSKKLRVAHRFKVTVHFEGTDPRNSPTLPLRPMSRAWADLTRASVMNFDDLDVDIVPTGSYLIVCENNSELLDTILPPLIDWKRRKGHVVDVLTFNGGANNTTIKSLIQNYYDNAEIPPEFVFLVGDVSGDYTLPGWNAGMWPSDQIDHKYSLLEGGDFLADVAVGRMPAVDDIEAITMRNKIFYYEKMPQTGSTDWFHQGCVIAGQGGSGISTVQVGRFIKTRMIQHEYTRVDTFWYWMGGSVETTTDNAFQAGISAYNYRGNYGMENFSVNDIYDLNNGARMPFVVTITCGTGGFEGNSLMETFCTVGTPGTPEGAIASVGTATLETHTRQNNTIAYGLWSGVYDQGLTQPGNALIRGKMELFNTYGANDYTSFTDFSEFAALAGDPGIELWTGPIRYMTCDVPSTITWGNNSITLDVEETGIGSLADAVVCLYKEGELHSVGLTDDAGQITLPVNITNPGNVKVTVTKQSFHPIVDSLDVIQANVAVGYLSHSIDDDNNGTSIGDDDGEINPGETVEIPLVFKNYGSTTQATNITVTATTTDEFITIEDGSETFPDILALATASSDDDLDITVASDCPDGHTFRIDLEVVSSEGAWEGEFELTVVSMDVELKEAYVPSGDTFLTAGATDDLVLRIVNGGGRDALSLTATLTSEVSFVTVLDNIATFGDVLSGDRASCGSDPFNVAADPYIAPGYPAEFTVTYTTSNGSVQSETLIIPVGQKSMTDPQGPDEYGYYCFDDRDNDYEQCPVYEWIEIDPAFGGPGNQLPINDPYENDDMSIVQQLPFAFSYYGQEIDDITICSNGWISANSDNSYADFRNYPIPSCVGPSGMIAPFWDDLVTWTSGHVFSYYDETNHRHIIEWSRTKIQSWGTQPEETFQIVLFDPAYYPTVTGDGEILFQYKDITNTSGNYTDNPYSTIGIENFEQNDGIEVSYWNGYDDIATAPLQDQRAYFFSTNFNYIPWNDVESQEEGIVELPSEYTLLGGYPNPFNPSTNIRFAMPEAGRIELSVFDVRGRLVANLINGIYQAGQHEVAFNAEGLASGVYFAQFATGDFRQTQKLLLLK